MSGRMEDDQWMCKRIVGEENVQWELYMEPGVVDRRVFQVDGRWL